MSDGCLSECQLLWLHFSDESQNKRTSAIFKSEIKCYRNPYLNRMDYLNRIAGFFNLFFHAAIDR